MLLSWVSVPFLPLPHENIMAPHESIMAPHESIMVQGKVWSRMFWFWRKLAQLHIHTYVCTYRHTCRHICRHAYTILNYKHTCSVLAHTYIVLTHTYIVLTHIHCAYAHTYVVLTHTYIVLTHTYIVLTHTCMHSQCVDSQTGGAYIHAHTGIRATPRSGKMSRYLWAVCVHH